ncbi:RNA polymerase sigma factor (sigma-70 family) [Algoriphagus iocasae]|jgi:RNA polymerase sigma factor (sigma-70 family)|uniref:RNA polymerase sigma factor (Sigma-70 family) n=1 Tax=Algoriphagus iocasae TaxID=1836499 RepID=A0A841MKX0_9BACT|nr:sigma-70 family RNA polymerase sigma factor [Algoriphagus iocasae]MBB6324886.1 RNA polymerase sigma factor (sigma-70 family) [Algoriphagus iocasae]
MSNSINFITSKSQKASKDSQADDKTLWRSLAKGNTLAFSSLYNRYANPLFNYGMNICYDREIVKDCIQELFTWLWTKRNSLTDVDSVKYYLFKSFRNSLVKSINKSRKFTDEPEDTFLESDLSVEEKIIEADVSVLNESIVKSALGKVSKRQREILILRFFNGMDYTQISSMMGISVASAHNLLSKSLKLMKSKI